MPYWDKINYFDLPGIDLDFHNKIEDYKRILKAADALTRLKMRLASKSLIMSQSWGWDPWFKCASARQTGPIYLRVA